MTRDATRSGYGAAFAVAEYRALFAAHTVSVLGDVVAALAVTVLVYARTGSALLAALVFTVSFVPHLVGGTLLSALADRLPARPLVVGCDLFSAGVVALVAVPGLPVPAVLGLLLLLNVAGPVAGGARAGVLPDIVGPDAYVPARSLFRLVSMGAQVAGGAVAAGLLAVVTPQQVLLLDAASFAASALLIRLGTRLRPARARGERGSTVRASLAGVRTVFAVPALRRATLLLWGVPAFAVFPEALAAPAVTDLGLGAGAIGWWLTAIPLGAVVGEVAGLRLLRPGWLAPSVGPLSAVVLAPLALFALRPGLAVALALLVVSGLGFAASLGVDRALLDAAPDALRGRVMSVTGAGLMTVQGLGFAVAGALGEAFDPPVVIAAGGLAGLAVLAALRPWRPARDGHDPDAPGAGSPGTGSPGTEGGGGADQRAVQA